MPYFQPLEVFGSTLYSDHGLEYHSNGPGFFFRGIQYPEVCNLDPVCIWVLLCWYYIIFLLSNMIKQNINGNPSIF